MHLQITPLCNIIKIWMIYYVFIRIRSSKFPWYELTVEKKGENRMLKFNIDFIWIILFTSFFVFFLSFRALLHNLLAQWCNKNLKASFPFLGQQTQASAVYKFLLDNILLRKWEDFRRNLRTNFAKTFIATFLNIEYSDIKFALYALSNEKSHIGPWEQSGLSGLWLSSSLWARAIIQSQAVHSQLYALVNNLLFISCFVFLSLLKK